MASATHIALLAVVAASTIALRAPASDESSISFARSVRPILAEHCFRCHGPDAAERRADLRLDERESALARAAIVPHHPESSALVRRIHAADPSDVMPPPEIHKPLSAAQRATLERWIEQGARYEAHWSYVAPTRHDPPAVTDPSLIRDPIDAFVLAKLDAAGIAPSREADLRTLARRVSLDLLGLPPTNDEVEALVADPTRYEAYVDQLLASPHFGERMATFWLDLARYADTVGYHGDQNLHAFPYRDWVVSAFNANLPFDRFTIAQLAGDLLPDRTTDDLVATGFNRLNMVTREGGAQPGEYLAKYAADRVRTVATTWLGSTVGCAECHDHKYDPFTTRDFYSLAAYFADVKQWGVYTTYAYTPNPDLPGFSNDHPFPPELEVESEYLAKRIRRLEDHAMAIAAEFVADIERDPAARTRFAEWRSEAIEFLSHSSDGFEIPNPRVVSPDGARLRDDRAVVVPRDATGKLSLALEPIARRIAAIEIELIPGPDHDGSILRGGVADALLRVSASVLLAADSGAEAKERAVRFRAGDGERAKPRYANGHAIRGIVEGWWVEAGPSGLGARARYLLDRPLELQSGESLVVTIDGAIGAARVRTSPFASESAAPNESFAWLAAALPHDDPLSDPRVPAVYLRSTAHDAARFDSIVAIDRDVRECDDGRAMTVITEAWAPRPTRVLPRGNWQDESGDLVEPSPPHFLRDPQSPLERRLDRLDLARWIVAEQNPLTARVFVNRVWKLFFGAALSSVVDDLGSQGEPPTHPELLDTLAVDFQRGGWDVKALVRRIVTSSTYRRDSKARTDLRDVDPYNRLLAGQNPRRLDAEFIRDNALAISGLLNTDLGGPPVFPYQPPRLFEHLQFPDRDWHASRDERQWRRALYTHWQRTFLHPSLAAFDAPSREECVASRTVANTPQQALVLLNDPTFVEAARGFAGVLLKSAPDDRSRVVAGYERALARPPSPAEIDAVLEYLASRRVAARTTPDETMKLNGVGIAPIPAGVDPLELAVWTQVCRVLLNLHECSTRT